MYAYTVELIGLIKKNLKEKDKNPVIVGMHWNQWEGDNDHTKATSYRENIETVITGLINATGQSNFPVYFYRPSMDERQDSNLVNGKTSTTIIREAIIDYVNSNQNFKLIDTTKYSSYDYSIPKNLGIFFDGVHYTADVQDWFADINFNDIGMSLNQ